VATRLAYARAKSAGVRLEPLLKAAQISRSEIYDPHIRLKVRSQIEFLNAVAIALKDDFIGFHLAQLPDLREIGLLYYVLASSSVLIEALRHAARYSSIVNDAVFAKCIDGRNVGLSFHYVGVGRHLDRHQMEFRMALFVRACRQLTGRRLSPSHARFIHTRDTLCKGYADYFGDDVKFGTGSDEITFPKDTRNLRVINADPYLNKILVRYCEEALTDRSKRRGSFRTRVENCVVPLLPHGEAHAGEVAHQLGVSRRTFVRRLSTEGLTFSKLLESLRFGLAKRYLASEDFSISQIAWLLGYEEVSSFSHAFKRWAGKTPRQARLRSRGAWLPRI
jgi:AraC-like DNA-binding protein